MRETSQTTVEYTKENNKKSKNNGELKDKQFVLRNSVLTDLFENPHIKTVHHLFEMIFLGLLMNMVVYDYIHNKSLTMGFRLIKKAFGDFHIALSGWTFQFLCTWLCFYCFHFWATVRIKLNPKSIKVNLWDFTWIAIVGLYYIFGFRIGAEIVNCYKLNVASSSVVVLETVRMLMKCHSFIRENAPKVLNFKSHSDQALELPKPSKFLYFLFAPTIIYRDEYPRTKKIRWSFVLDNLIQVILIIFAYASIYENLIIPIFGDFALRRFTIWDVIVGIFKSCMPALLLVLCTFYLILHCWQNMFAELLRFGDRLFYSDWWTVTTYGEYFRKWNIVVGDWLYTYIYKDIHDILLPKNKLVAKIAVFLLSAIVHEWCLTYIYGFFFPFLFVIFLTFGVLLSYIYVPKTNVLNMLFWYGLSFGSSLVTTIYTIEYLTRSNVPIENPPYWDFFKPRCFSYIDF